MIPLVAEAPPETPAVMTTLFVPGDEGTTKLSPVPAEGATREPNVKVLIPAVGVICTTPAPAVTVKTPSVSLLPVLKAL